MYGQGGLRTEATTTARDAIKLSRLEEGMKVYCQDTRMEYRLKPSYATPPSGATDWGIASEKVSLQHSGSLPQGATIYFGNSQSQSTAIPCYIAEGAQAICKMRIKTRVSNGAAHTDTYTVQINGADQAMVVAITNSTVGSYDTAPLALVDGDIVTVKCDTDIATTAEDVLIQLVIG